MISGWTGYPAFQDNRHLTYRISSDQISGPTLFCIEKNASGSPWRTSCIRWIILDIRYPSNNLYSVHPYFLLKLMRVNHLAGYPASRRISGILPDIRYSAGYPVSRCIFGIPPDIQYPAGYPVSRRISGIPTDIRSVPTFYWRECW